MYIMHISKLKFLCSFCIAFFIFMTEKNIKGGFIGASLMLYGLQRVLLKLDVYLRTLTPLADLPKIRQP